MLKKLLILSICESRSSEKPVLIHLRFNVKIYRYTFIFIIIFIICNPNSHARIEYKLPAESYELLLRFNYQGIVRSDLMAMNYNKKTYLPFLEILNKLKIYYEFDYSRKIIEGYFISKDSAYYVDFRTGNGESFDAKINIDKNDFLIAPMEVFVLPEVFKMLFNFEVTVNYLKLSAYVDSKIDLPIMSEYRRFKGYSFLKGPGISDGTYSPLMFDRNRSFLNGGTVYYNLRASQYNDIRNYSFSTNLGIELFGGDFQINTGGNYSEADKLFNYNNLYRWRFNLGDNPFLTNISMGNINTSGYRSTSLPSLSLSGIQFTNEDTEYPIAFSTMTYEEQLEPGWQVELYKNGFLYEHKTTDAQGYYRFELPVDYGSSNIELRFYGPKGEYLVKKELIRIANEFLVPGDVRYSLNFGERASDNVKIAEGRLSVGITDWLSNSISISKFDSSKSYTDLMKSKDLMTLNNVDLYNSLSLRMFNNLYTTFDYSPENLYKLSLNFWPLDYGSYSARYTIYDKKSNLNYSGQKSRAELYFQLPRFFDLPFTLNANMQRNEYDSYANSTLSSNIYFNIGYLIVSGYYRANYRESKTDNIGSNLQNEISLNFSYNWFDMPKFLSSLDNINFRANVNMDLSSNKLRNVSFSINPVLFKNLYVYYDIEKSFLYDKSINMSLGLRFNLSAIRYETKIDSKAMKDMSYEQELQGIIGYNSSTNDFLFSNATVFSNLGSGAANIRIFLDENGNDAYDEGEQLIPDVRVNIPRATINSRSSGDMIQVYNLTPYTRYNVVVDKSSFKNPLWIPKFTEFSFISDPNSYKALDIPCYVGGVLEGTVFKKDTSGRSGQAGVKIHIANADSSYMQSIPVFSDGSFYYLGVPPGKYIAYVDSMQLRVLNCVSDPIFAAFEVKATKDGDFVSGINFDLIPEGVTIESPRLPTAKESVTQKGSATELIADKPLIPDVTAEVPSAPERGMVMNRVFGYKKAKNIKLSSGIKKYLNRVADYLKANPEAEVAIIGHSDNFGDMKQTQKVSEKRANEARYYLVSKKVSRDRIMVRGMGSRSPVEDNSTPDGRKKNRRIEIKIID